MNFSKYLDIDMAEKNWIEIDGNSPIMFLKRSGCEWHGDMANKLVNSRDFKVPPFSFSVWEVTNNTYDNRTDAVDFACIHRANQSTLEGALHYMVAPGDNELGISENRVLVYNKAYPEKVEDGFISDEVYSQ